MKVAILNNLRAGRSRPLVSKILSVLRDYPHVYHVETESARVMPDVLAELAREDLDLLIVNGGDGTLQFLLTELLGNPDYTRIPLIAPLRGGRTNMTALDLGTDRNPVRALRGLLRSAETGSLRDRLVRRPVLRVNSFSRGTAHYGMFFGAGMIHRAITLTHKLFPPGASQGSFGAGIVTAGLILKALSRPTGGVLEPDKVQVLIDGKPVDQGEFYLVISSSLERLFLRINPFWGEGDGGVRFTSVATSVKRLKYAIPGVMTGRPRPWVTAENGYTSANAHRVELRLDCGYTVDGEIFSPKPDEVVTLTVDRRVTFVRA